MTTALHTTAPDAADLTSAVEAVAARSGAWVVVESAGHVLAHGPGHCPCPAALADALLSKRTGPLRAGTRWTRGSGLMRGSVDGTALTAADLGEALTAWFVGAAPDDADVRLLAEVVRSEPLPHDSGIDELIRPRGPARPGAAAAAELLAVRADLPLAVLCRDVRRAVAGAHARLHVMDDCLLIALPPDTAVEVAAAITAAVPTAVLGAARVPPSAPDWAATAQQAVDAMRAAARLGLRVGRPDTPAIGLEIVARKVRQAVEVLVRDLPEHPLGRLIQHDDSSGSELMRTLDAWCRSGFDVSATAEAMHLHPNTLRYRLRRARHISGVDHTDPRQRLALQLLLST